MTGRALAVGALALAAAAGCQDRSLRLMFGGLGADAGVDRTPYVPPLIDAGPRPDRLDAGQPDSGPFDGGGDACTAMIDRDPANCGACGNVCRVTGALPACANGACTIDQCLPGFIDLNGRHDDGCEYVCTVTQAGTEVCDDVDNDCDGQTDEMTDKQTDTTNCGACGRHCTFLHAAGSCSGGSCVLGACTTGFVNANGMAADGCECALSNGGTEICDGIDNDCNGHVDDVPAAGTNNDVQHCGACNRNCTTLPHAVGMCTNAACVIAGCAFGFSNLNGNTIDGCEHACPGGWTGGTEVCDGVDNDCDGKVDADDDSLLASTNFCATRGECAGSRPVCTGGSWVCNYPATVEVTAPNVIIGNETRCDGKDNDCDGCIDETFPQVGLAPAAVGGSCTATTAQVCRDSGIGTCQGTGRTVCNAPGTGTTCQITTPGTTPTAELCDGLDNNCDGIVDNGGASDPARVREPMVAISGGGLPQTVYVYAYEASRPDAGATSAGTSGARACAKAGALPWTNLTHAAAAAACQAAGKRLCTEAEWQRACQTAAASACSWSFASACTTSSTATCNTHELDGDAAMSGDQDVLVGSGSRSSCYAEWGSAGRIHDLTGNAKEWTAARAAGVNPLRGGSYLDLLEGSTCAFSFVAVDSDYKLANAGFRCCSDTAP